MATVQPVEARRLILLGAPRMTGVTEELVVDSRSASETLQIARALGRVLSGGEVIALVGELGSGKTTFTKGLCTGLGVRDSRIVSSPTYVLEHVYEGRVTIHHYDSYRLGGPGEFLGLGFRDHLDSASVLVVEWADKVLDALPGERLLVELSAKPGSGAEPWRTLRFSGPASVWSARLREARISTCEAQFVPDPSPEEI